MENTSREYRFVRFFPKLLEACMRYRYDRLMGTDPRLIEDAGISDLNSNFLERITNSDDAWNYTNSGIDDVYKKAKYDFAECRQKYVVISEKYCDLMYHLGMNEDLNDWDDYFEWILEADNWERHLNIWLDCIVDNLWPMMCVCKPQDKIDTIKTIAKELFDMVKVLQVETHRKLDVELVCKLWSK